MKNYKKEYFAYNNQGNNGFEVHKVGRLSELTPNYAHEFIDKEHSRQCRHFYDLKTAIQGGFEMSSTDFPVFSFIGLTPAQESLAKGYCASIKEARLKEQEAEFLEP